MPTFFTTLRPVWRTYVEAIFRLTIAFSVFALILLNRSPNLLRPISMSLRTSLGLSMAAAVVLLYVTFRLPGWIGRLLALTLTLSLFALPLAGLWASGQTQTTVINGLIPLYDAYDYYTDALRLLAGHDFSVFSARRPLFPGLFSVVLALTGRNLMTSLAVFAAITGLACYLAAREIQRTHGAEAAVFILVILFLFYRAHEGVAMSENLGVPLGALGFALIWRGTADRNRWLVLAGMFAITLALNARAGAFFVLPLLVLWASWFFRENNARFSWKFAFLSCAAIVIGFVFNLLLVRLLAAPSGVPFANFSYTLYGVASGGYTWSYIFMAHPEVLALQEPAQSQRIYQLAFDLIRQHPELFMRGALHAWETLFSNSWYSLYSYVTGDSEVVNLIVHYALYALGILGIYKWFRNRSDPFNSLMMAAAAGVFLSVPFLPPTDSYRVRPYAVTIIIFGLVPAMGLVFLLERFGRRFFFHPLDQLQGREWSAGFTVSLILVTLVGPLLVKGFGSHPDLPVASCGTGQDSIVIRFDPGTSINIFRENQNFLDWMPNFHLSLLRGNSHSLVDTHLVNWLEQLTPPYTLFYTLDYRTYRKALVTTDPSLLPRPGSNLELCGKWETDANLTSYDIFYADQVKVLH